MDYVLDIIIPRDELKEIRLSEVLREWGDEKFSLIPAMYITDSGIEFTEVTDLSYYNRIFKLKVDKELIALHLKSHILYEFEWFANNQSGKASENALLKFLISLFKLSKFYIILVREDESVKEKYEISDEEEIESVLLNCVNWSTPTDVLLYR